MKRISSDGFQADPKAHSSDRIGIACAHIEQHLSGSVYVPEIAVRMLALIRAAAHAAQPDFGREILKTGKNLRKFCKLG